MNRTNRIDSSFGLYDLMPFGVIVLQPNYTVEYWNDYMTFLTDISSDQIEGTNLLLRYPTLKNPAVLDRISQIFNGGPSIFFSPQFHPHLIPCPLLNGTLRILKISCIPLNHDNEKYALVVIEDVTDLTNQVKAYREMKRVADQQLEKLKKAQGSIFLANKKLNILSGITRHDINNQLMTLMAFLTILEEEQHDPALNRYCQMATTAAQRISSMIQFTKEYEAIGVNSPAWQDCCTLVDTAAKDATLGHVMVKIDLPAGTEVFADPLIVKVFYNLMDNAVRYGGKITTIRFSVQESGDDHLIVCEDDGDGVLQDEKERIFERGFGKNTGLGLAISREILDITGITIKETGEPGKGARFDLTVPNGAYRFIGTQ